MSVLLDVKNLNVRFKQDGQVTHAVRDVSFQLGFVPLYSFSAQIIAPVFIRLLINLDCISLISCCPVVYNKRVPRPRKCPLVLSRDVARVI